LRIIILTSRHPYFGHLGCGEFVLASLCKGLINSGYDVSYAFVGTNNEINKNVDIKIKELGINYLGDFSDQLIINKPKSIFSVLLKVIKSYFNFREIEDYGFKNSHEIVSKLGNNDDLFLLFWDSYFEYILNDIKNIKMCAFYAKSPHDSSLIDNKNKKFNNENILDYLKLNLIEFFIRRKIRNNINRMKALNYMSNICNLDVKKFRSYGVNVEYIPLSIPDCFKDYQINQEIKKVDYPIKIIGGLGKINATGSRIGLNFLLKNILPTIDSKLYKNDWIMNFYGKGYAKKDINIIDSYSNLKFYGFVDDIDRELIRNDIALLFNNAGNYTGTYTRVPYLMSSGICLIAHKNLGKSVPELINGKNIIMGETSEEISELIIETIHNEDLRRNIGNNARKTFLEYFSVEKVVEKFSQGIKNI